MLQEHESEAQAHQECKSDTYLVIPSDGDPAGFTSPMSRGGNGFDMQLLYMLEEYRSEAQVYQWYENGVIHTFSYRWTEINMIPQTSQVRCLGAVIKCWLVAQNWL